MKTGTPVIVRLDDGIEYRTETRSEPWSVCGRAVVLLRGISGGYALERVRPWLSGPDHDIPWHPNTPEGRLERGLRAIVAEQMGEAP